VSWIVKRYGKYGRKVSWIVKRLENTVENSEKIMGIMKERSVE
jgi:GTP-dependent phosphoenolpyruvate carboxykinase